VGSATCSGASACGPLPLPFLGCFLALKNLRLALAARGLVFIFLGFGATFFLALTGLATRFCEKIEHICISEITYPLSAS
jgi:hypothetical protein